MASTPSPNAAPGCVAITGASDGIGKALALEFARRGHPLALIARRKELLEALAADCRAQGSPRVEFAALDVTDSRLLRDALGAFDERFGGIVVYIANAGVANDCDFREDEFEAIRQMMQVNVLAAIDGIEFLKPRMLARKSGTLVGVASVAAARGFSMGGPYSASKAALYAYLEALEVSLKRRGVRVVTVAPGFIDTAMTRKNEFKMPFLMDVRKACRIFARDILAGKSVSIAPWQFKPIFWLLRAMPNFVFRRLPPGLL